ncbi:MULTISPECIES: hypothetical protein [Alphaproteobacteria]|uniref:hypothetical protein n=1 Tax=Sphingopyxis sp. TaxID=1908224 RepID=UPI0040346DE5
MTQYTNTAGWDFIDPDSVEAEYFSGPVHCERNDPDCDFGHITMTDKFGRSWFARPILKGENVDEVIERLKRNGTIDEHCAYEGLTDAGRAHEQAYIREMSKGS